MNIVNNYNFQNDVQFGARIRIKKPKYNELAKSGLVSTGTSSIIGGNASSLATCMDHSVHYPLLGSENLPQPFLNFAKESALQKSAYEYLYSPYGLGNQTALIPGSLSSSILNSVGSIFNRFGLKK